MCEVCWHVGTPDLFFRLFTADLLGGQLKYIAIKVNGILVGVGWFT